MEWPNTIERWGFAGACLALLAYFLGKTVWPFFSNLIIKNVDKAWEQVAAAREELQAARAETQASQERFLHSLEDRDQKFINALERHSAAFDRLAAVTTQAIATKKR